MAIYPTGASSDADLYIASDNFSTTLSIAIDNVQTTISVNSVVGLPTVGILTIESEKVKYTGISGNDLTGCTRGFSSTSAASHALGATVVFNIVEEHHNVLKDEIKAIETDLIAIKAALNDADTPAATASDVKDRLDQVVSEIKLITGNANWYDVVAKNLTQLLPLSGGTMTGNIAMSGTQKLTGLAAGSTNGDSVRYEQLFGQFLPLSGGTLTGALLIPDGTQAAPSLAFGSNSQVGFCKLSANTMSAVINGTIMSTYSIASGVSLLGTNTSTSAAAGYVGEYAVSVISSPANAPTTNQFGDLTSISLTAGDWDITAIGNWSIASGVDTWTGGSIGISSTSGNSGTGLVVGDNRASDTFASSNTTPILVPQTIPSYRVSLSATTTYYLKYRATYSAGTPTCVGRISARRVR